MWQAEATLTRTDSNEGVYGPFNAIIANRGPLRTKLSDLHKPGQLPLK
jgi:hypothetical protein